MIVHLIEYCKYGAAHFKPDDLIDGMSTREGYGTVLGYVVIVVDEKLNISKL